MADSTEGDTEVQDLDILPSALIALIAGLVIHSFIIGVNVNDWWKGRSVTPVDQIVTSLGISRMCAQGANALCIFMSTVFGRSLDLHVALAIIDIVYAFFTFTSVWLSSLLSIVFCLKISNLQNRLFLYLKRMILQRTGYFIVASMLFSTLNSFITLAMAFTAVTSGGANNTTTDCMQMIPIYNITIEAFFPLIFYYISSVLLFTSLYHHTTRMKMSSNLTINLETYYSVMKFVSFTFIYSTIYFIGHFACIFYYYFYCVYLLWFYMSLDFLSVLHSSYLIYRTTKLRNQMSKVLQDVINFLFQQRDTETRENIKVVTE